MCLVQETELSEKNASPPFHDYNSILECNPNPAHTCPTIKGLLPASTAFNEPLVYNGRAFTTNQGRVIAFMKVYVAVNRLNLSRTDRSRIRQLKEVQPSELDPAKRPDVWSPCMATLGSCNPSRTAGTLSKPRTSCDNRSASDNPNGEAEVRSRGMQHDGLNAPADRHRIRESRQIN